MKTFAVLCTVLFAGAALAQTKDEPRLQCPRGKGGIGVCVFNPDINCSGDDKCQNGQICCPDGCNRVCKNGVPAPKQVTPPSSSGRCPPTTPTFGACVFNPEINCADDSACTNGKICCPDGCNSICKAPAPQLPPPTEEPKKGSSEGRCPPTTPTFGACVFNPEINCVDDSACTNGKVCCPDGCNRICKAPAPQLPPPTEEPKKESTGGKCPPSTPTFGACVFNPEINCKDDDACTNGKICCQDGCNRICKPPTPELPPLVPQEPKEKSKGKCPPATPTFGACVFNPEINCADNDFCKNGQICCPSGCNNVCVNPLPTPVHASSKP